MKYNLGHNFMRAAHYTNDEYFYALADSFSIVPDCEKKLDDCKN